MDSLIEPEANVASFFDVAVRTAAEARGYDPDAPSTRYVAGVLTDYARPEAIRRHALDRPLTLLLAEALETNGGARFQRLRELGDHVLYLSGFFADHLERNGAPRSFVRSVGAAAYDRAGALIRGTGGQTRGPDVFDELATHFDELAQVLSDVADALFATGARDPRGVLDLYERWTRRGSHALAKALLHVGAVPARGKGLVH